MTPVPRYSYAIAAGYNISAPSLVNIETIKPTGDAYFYPPSAYGFYNPGQYIIRGDGSLYIAGYPSTQWAWIGNPGGMLTRLQALYLMTTYCNSGYSGQVTISTRTDNPATYSRFNAIMILPKLPDAGRNFTIFNQYTIQFTHMVAL